MVEEEYKRRYTFAMDYGTSDFKFGPITCGETPEIVENRGYFPDKESILYKTFETPKDVIVGKEVPLYLQSSEDLSTRLIYPLKNGVIDRDDAKAWQVVEEISRHGLGLFQPKAEDFKGYYLVASLSSVSPRYMYEKLFNIYERIDSETEYIKASTIIPQPLAVAIAHKETTCVVLESGHGNTQVCPISKYPIRNAIVAINRGGGDANALTSEILKDIGYGDLARQESLVRRVKENMGLIPRDLDVAVRKAKEEPKKFKAKFKIPGTRIVIDLDNQSWTRFLIGEYVFNPNHEEYNSYFIRGMLKPKDLRVGDTFFQGMIDFGEAIIQSVERCPIELQPYLYRKILLSGGNFQWNSPAGMEEVAVDAQQKIRILLKRHGITNVKVNMTQDPQFSVWKGCIIYGYAVPEGYRWSWDKMEGWRIIRERS